MKTNNNFKISKSKSKGKFDKIDKDIKTPVKI